MLNVPVNYFNRVRGVTEFERERENLRDILSERERMIHKTKNTVISIKII